MVSIFLSNFNLTSNIEDNSPLHPGVQEKLVLNRSFGRTMSRNLAELMCESSTLRTVVIGENYLTVSFHEDFFSLLAEKGNKSAVNNHTFQSCSIIMAILPGGGGGGYISLGPVHHPRQLSFFRKKQG